MSSWFPVKAISRPYRYHQGRCGRQSPPGPGARRRAEPGLATAGRRRWGPATGDWWDICGSYSCEWFSVVINGFLIGSSSVNSGLFLYVYICIYIHMYMYIYIHMYMYICIYVYMYIYMYICIYIYMYICIYVYMYICIYVYMYICIYVYMYICIYVYMYVCIYIYIYVGGIWAIFLS